ncbi:MAG: helix-turn-helix transcriptional regulator [Acidobacteria bacterium]|nr:helix-turn-helix transcriptional regulator [Acidobacteriota bacterium]
MKKMESPMRGLRRARGLTLDAVSAKSGLDRALLSRLERDLVRPTARSRKALSKFFDFPEHILFPGVER